MPRGPLDVVVPVVPPSVRRSLGGSHCSYKGAAALASARQMPSNRTEPPPAPLRAAAASSEFQTTASQIKPSFTAPSTYRNYRAAPPIVPRPQPRWSWAHHGWPRLPPPRGSAGTPTAPDFGQIRPLATPAQPHTVPWPAPPPALAGIWPEPRRPRPRGPDCKGQILPEGQSAN
jgi:hypothetical protein